MPTPGPRAIAYLHLAVNVRITWWRTGVWRYLARETTRKCTTHLLLFYSHNHTYVWYFSIFFGCVFSLCTIYQMYAMANVHSFSTLYHTIPYWHIPVYARMYMHSYIFPAMGLAAVSTGARHIAISDFYVAAIALARQVNDWMIGWLNDWILHCITWCCVM